MGISIIEDEIDKKRRELIEKGLVRRETPFSPLEVKNPKPGRVYRAVYDDPRRIAEVKAQGYEVSKDAEFAVGELKEKRFVYKDVVLMDCDQESYVERHAKYRAGLEIQSQAIRGNARENINRVMVDEGGAPASKDHTFDETRSGPTRNYMSEEEE